MSNYLPPDTYLVRVVDVRVRVTRKGDPMWRLTLSVQDGEFAGRWLFDQIVFNERARERTSEALASLGIEGFDDVEPRAVLGERCLVHVEVEEWEGRKRNVIGFRGYAPEASDPTRTSLFDDDGWGVWTH